MKHVCKKVYELYPSIKIMAAKLNESPKALEKAMQAGRLPDRRHDNEILMLALYKGSTLTHIHLKNYRREHQNEF